MLAYANDELGMYRVTHILLATRDIETGEDLDEAACADKKAQAEELLEQIKSAGDPVAKFDELMKEHSEDPGLATNPDGYVAYPGQMMKPFEEASLALKEGEYSGVVESDAGYHIILRLPFEDLEPFRNELINHLMEKKADQWLEEYEVKPARAMKKIDVKEFYENALSLKSGVMEEIKAAEAAKNPAPDASAPDASAPAPDASASKETKPEG